MGQYARCGLSSVVVCNAAGGRADRPPGARVVGLLAKQRSEFQGKHAIFSFMFYQVVSAEALVMSDGRIKYRLTAYLLINIPV